MKTFLISDTHFGHANIIEYCGRPFANADEMDEALVTNWNSVVSPEDKVYHLGDVTLSKSKLPILERLNGHKTLIRGNHDNSKLKDYALYFGDVLATKELAGFLLSHIPVHDSQKYRFKGNIHGHLHDKVIDDPWYINVSVEHTGYTPVLLDSVITIAL